MTDKTEEKQAPMNYLPLPNESSQSEAWQIYRGDNIGVAVVFSSEEDAKEICRAVNAYEQDQETIKALVEAAKLVKITRDIGIGVQGSLKLGGKYRETYLIHGASAMAQAVWENLDKALAQVKERA